MEILDCDDIYFPSFPPPIRFLNIKIIEFILIGSEIFSVVTTLFREDFSAELPTITEYCIRRELKGSPPYCQVPKCSFEKRNRADQLLKKYIEEPENRNITV